METKDEIIVRKVTEADFDALVALYEDVWWDIPYDKRAKATFVLKDSTGVNYCADWNGRIVGSRMSFYCNVYYGERKLNCVQCADSCVHKDCRGKHLFLRLNEAFLKDFFQKGELVFNISVIASRKANEKLGWVYIESLATMRKFCNPFKALLKVGFDIRKLMGNVDWDNSRNDELVIDEKLLEVREKLMRERNALHMCYDAKTLLWRGKADSGIRKMDIAGVGSVMYKIGAKHGVNVVNIGEIFLYEYNYANYKKAEKAIRKALKPDILMVSVTKSHPMLEYYKKAGFIYNFRQKYLHHGVRVESDEMRQICLNPDNWAMSTMDIDTF